MNTTYPDLENNTNKIKSILANATRYMEHSNVDANTKNLIKLTRLALRGVESVVMRGTSFDPAPDIPPEQEATSENLLEGKTWIKFRYDKDLHSTNITFVVEFGDSGEHPPYTLMDVDGYERIYACDKEMYDLLQSLIEAVSERKRIRDDISGNKEKHRCLSRVDAIEDEVPSKTCKTLSLVSAWVCTISFVVACVSFHFLWEIPLVWSALIAIASFIPSVGYYSSYRKHIKKEEFLD